MALESALAAADAAEVLRICEESELEAAEEGCAHPFPTEHMLSLVVIDDLDEARFLWRRLNTENRSVTEPAWSLVKAIWRHDRPMFYKCISYTWPDSLRPIVALIVSRMRVRMVDLLNLTYSVVSADRLCSLLGVDHSALDSVCREQNWKREGDYIVISQDICNKRDRLVSSTPNLTGSGPNTAFQSSESRKPFSELETLTEQLVKLQTT